MAMPTRNSYAAGHFELRIDGYEPTAYVKSVEGGWSRANIVDEAVGPSPQRLKQITTVERLKFELYVHRMNIEGSSILGFA